jgi:2-polyprenyl-6-methoxyphenol hydroxylase-like FAD-dependent oxidoreductase
MRVLVVGAGIIGSIYGWALRDSGHDVVHLMRRGRADALQEGFTIDMRDLRQGRKRHFRGVYKLAATESVSQAWKVRLRADRYRQPSASISQRHFARQVSRPAFIRTCCTTCGCSMR